MYPTCFECPHHMEEENTWFSCKTEMYTDNPKAETSGSQTNLSDATFLLPVDQGRATSGPRRPSVWPAIPIRPADLPLEVVKKLYLIFDFKMDNIIESLLSAAYSVGARPTSLCSNSSSSGSSKNTD